MKRSKGEPRKVKTLNHMNVSQRTMPFAARSHQTTSLPCKRFMVAVLRDGDDDDRDKVMVISL